MDCKGINKWLDERGLEMGESFPAALRRFSKIYKKSHNIVLLNDVYAAIGTSKQEISLWRKRILSTQSKKNINIMLSAQQGSYLGYVRKKQRALQIRQGFRFTAMKISRTICAA